MLTSPRKYFAANLVSYKPELQQPSKYSEIRGASDRVEKALRAIRIFTLVSNLSFFKTSKLLLKAFLSITKQGLGKEYKSNSLKFLGLPPIVCNIFIL